MPLLRTRDHALLAAGIMLASLASVLSCLSIPAFAEVFQGHAHVPAATSILVRFYWLLLLFPLIVLAAWRYWPNQQQRGTAALVAGLAIFFGGQAIVQAILYLPALEFGR